MFLSSSSSSSLSSSLSSLRDHPDPTRKGRRTVSRAPPTFRRSQHLRPRVYPARDRPNQTPDTDHAALSHNFRYEIAVTVTVQWRAWPSRTPSGNAASGSARALPRLRPGLTEVYPTHFQPHPRSLSPRPQARRASQGPSRRPSPPAAAARASRPRRFPPAASLIRSCRSTSRCDDAVARSSRSGSRGGSATATGDVSRPRCGPSRRPFHTTSNSSSSVAILEPGESCGPVEIHPGLEPGRDGQLARVDQPLIGPARHAVAPLLVADTRDARTDRQRLGAAEVSDRTASRDATNGVGLDVPCLRGKSSSKLSDGASRATSSAATPSAPRAAQLTDPELAQMIEESDRWERWCSDPRLWRWRWDRRVLYLGRALRGGKGAPGSLDTMKLRPI